METPPSNDSLKASLNPPVGGCLCSFRRDWQTNKCSNIMLNILTIHHQSKFARVPLILSGPDAHQDPALASYPVKECNRKGGKCKIQSPVPNPQASPRVEANDRHKQTHNQGLCFQGNGCRPTCQTHAFSFPFPKLKEVPDRVLRVNNKIIIVGYELHIYPC